MTTCANPRCGNQFPDRVHAGWSVKYCNRSCKNKHWEAVEYSDAKTKYRQSAKGKATHLRKRSKYAVSSKGKQVGQRYRANMLDAYDEDVDVLILANWQGWKCYLCDKSISPKIKHPEQLSLSLDHLIPLSLGGRHSYANCAAVHLICNSKKQAQAKNEQLKLC